MVIIFNRGIMIGPMPFFGKLRFFPPNLVDFYRDIRICILRFFLKMAIFFKYGNI